MHWFIAAVRMKSLRNDGRMDSYAKGERYARDSGDQGNHTWGYGVALPKSGVRTFNILVVPQANLLGWKKGGSHPKFPHVPTRAVDLPGGPRTMGRSSSEEGGIISKTITWNCELWICTGLSLTALLRNLSTGVSAVELYSQCQGLSTLLSLMYVGRDAEEIPT